MNNSLPILKSFNTIRTWMQQYVLDVHFRPPANPDALAHFEEVSGLVIPDSLRQLLLQADGETHVSAGMFGNWRLMSIAEIQAAWGYLTQITKKGVFNELDPKPSPYITRTWWHPGWIPFITSDAGDYFCLDTDPIEPQRTGQIILFLREHPERYLIATSLDDWLALISQTLFAGFFAYDPERGFNNEAFMCSALEGKHFFEGRRSLITNEQNDKKDTP